MKTLTCGILSLFVVASSHAQEQSQEPGFHEHDGFFLSMSLGPGYSSTEDKSDQTSYAVTFSGLAVAVDIRIGGTIARDLVLSGDMMGRIVQDPKLDFSGGASGTLEKASFGQYYYGAGLTYYIMPSNIFLSGSVGVSYFSLERDSERYRTDPGFGFFVKAGKEWWVGADWALGVAATFGYSSVNNEANSVTETLSGYSVNIHFNATFH